MIGQIIGSYRVISERGKGGMGMVYLAEQRFTVARKSVRSGEPIEVMFAAPMHAAPGERFWITIVTRDTADTSWGSYAYAPADARRMKLAAPAEPGEYEIRLHANDPKQSTNVVHRVDAA